MTIDQDAELPENVLPSTAHIRPEDAPRSPDFPIDQDAETVREFISLGLRAPSSIAGAEAALARIAELERLCESEVEARDSADRRNSA